jgi:trk system potassium uptake protein
MKVAIAGAGAVGTFIAEDLRNNGHEVLVLEMNPELVAKLQNKIDVQWHVADACEFESLRAAGVGDADVMVAATGDDEDNLVISLLSKQEFGIDRVIARVNNPKNHWLFNESWGVDVAVSTPHLLTALVEEAVSVGSLVQLLNLDGGARIVEVRLNGDSPAVDKLVGDLTLPRDATLVAIIRDRHVMVPQPDVLLRANDEILALVTGDAEPSLKAIFLA